MQHLSLLGPVHIGRGRDRSSPTRSSTIPRFRSQRTIAILGYLVIERRPVARAQLASLFWPDEAPDKGRSNLRRELYSLTRILPDCWVTSSQTAGFSASADTTVDVYQLTQLVAEGRWRDAAPHLSGEFLEGVHLTDNVEFGSWLMAERERWRSQSETILMQACDAAVDEARYLDALSYGRRLLQVAPWNEEAQRRVISLLSWTDQREAALRQFELCQEALQQELGVEPAQETIALASQIRQRQHRRPQKPPAFLADDASRAPSGKQVFVTRERELANLNQFLREALAGQSRVVFLTGGPGRGKTALMNAFAQQALNQSPDLLIANGNCKAYSGSGDPYSPFRDILSMLTGDVEASWLAGTVSGEHARRLWRALPLVVQLMLAHSPQLFDVLVPSNSLLKLVKSRAPAGAPWQTQLQQHIQTSLATPLEVEQAHIYEQFTRLLQNLARQQPLVLFLDDMQWVDEASVGLLFHLGRRLAAGHHRILVVCAYRPAEILRDIKSGRHLLAKLLGEFKRTFGDVWITLNWQDEEGRRFVDALIDSEPNQLSADFRTALFRRTAGHPLFTVELLQAMQARGDLVPDTRGHWQEGTALDWQLLPARVEAVIEERIRQLDPVLQEILAAASVEGKIFTAEIVASLRQTDIGRLLQQLGQELGRRYGLVKEHEPIQTSQGTVIRYRFSHDLFQEFLYGQLSRGERHLAHREVARQLETLFAGRLESVAVQLAHHYDRANEYVPAIRYYALAAQQAASVFANDEAITHYSRAIELLPAAAEDDFYAAHLYHMRGVAYRTTGRFAEADDDMHRALSEALAADDVPLEWRVLIDLGKLWSSRSYGQAREFFERALAVARQLPDPRILGNSLNWLGNWHANNEEPAVALALHQDAMQIYTSTREQLSIAKTYDLLGITYLLAGDFRESVAHYNHSVEIFHSLGDLPNLATSLMGRAVTATAPAFLTLVPTSQWGNPGADFEKAIEIAQKIGSFPDEAWSAWPRALLMALQGDLGQALKIGRHGLQIAEDIEHREWIVGNRFALGILLTEMLVPEEARPELERGLQLANELNSQYWINHLSGALARAFVRLDQLEDARRSLHDILAQ